MSIEQKTLRKVKSAIREELQDQIFLASLELIANISEENKARLRFQFNSFATVQTMPLSQEMIVKKAKELKVIAE